MSDISLNLESFQIMEYWKIKKGIREILEKNNERISDRAEARVVRMSQKGYISMMDNQTMTVKKLEEIASILNKPASYFFVKNETKETNTVSEPSVKTYSCPDCIAKQKEIDALQKALDAKEELLNMYRDKNKKEEGKCG